MQSCQENTGTTCLYEFAPTELIIANHGILLTSSWILYFSRGDPNICYQDMCQSRKTGEFFETVKNGSYG
jgi:hypothetical protein